MGITSRPMGDKLKIYSAVTLLIRRKLIRKTIAGIITNEITITLKIIVQFIPIISQVKI